MCIGCAPYLSPCTTDDVPSVPREPRECQNLPTDQRCGKQCNDKLKKYATHERIDRTNICSIYQ